MTVDLPANVYSYCMEVSIVWFRRDLRLHDNEAVAKAADAGKQCLYVFVIDPWFFNQPETGWLRVRFLFESLASLDTALVAKGSRLIILKGETVLALTGLMQRLGKNGYQPTLYYNHDIQVAYGQKRDAAVQAYCNAQGISVQATHNYFLLHDEAAMNDWWRRYYEYQYDEQHKPSVVQASDAAISLQAVIDPLPRIDPQHIAEALQLQLPTARQALFTGGETAARQAVYSFLKDRVGGYRWKLSRPYLAQQGATSLLGPHLAFGTISNRTVFQAAVKHRNKLQEQQPKKAFDISTYLDRLRWRDSFTQRLWFHPELIWQNRFSEFNDVYNEQPLSSQQQDYFKRWQHGETGFPLVDASMKQLKHDGFINFRMRAMAATFLTINCGVSWQHGARHFMNCLVDGDIAINHWQWQMQAGITNPLSPTFRMYSPTKNLRDRDPAADYVHFWLPETRGKNIDTIIEEAQPMLDFNASRKTNGKIIADLRKQVRQRIIAKKGIELDNAKVAHRVVVNYGRYSAGRYKRALHPVVKEL